MPEKEAIAEHRNLADAFKTMHAAAQYFKAQMPQDAKAQRNALLAVRKHVQTKLDQGETKYFRQSPADKQKARQAGPSRAREARQGADHERQAALMQYFKIDATAAPATFNPITEAVRTPEGVQWLVEFLSAAAGVALDDDKKAALKTIIEGLPEGATLAMLIWCFHMRILPLKKFHRMFTV